MTLTADSFTAFAEGLCDEAGAAVRVAELVALPLPPMPAPAAEIEPEPISVPAGGYAPWPLRGSPGDVQVYRPSQTYGVRERGLDNPYPDFLGPSAVDQPVDARTAYSDGVPLAATWVAPRLGWVWDENTTDFPLAFGSFAVRLDAREVLRPVVERYGELLPVETETGPLWIFRCLNNVDALAPSVRYGEGYNGYYDILDVDFVPERVDGAGIFVIPKQTWSAQVFFPATSPRSSSTLTSAARRSHTYGVLHSMQARRRA